MEDFYKKKKFDTKQLESPLSIGLITEKDKLLAAKQILLGLAILYLCTLFVYLLDPSEGDQLIDVCTTIFPPLATLILVSYFREKYNN